MIVTSGSEWIAPGGQNRRSWSIALDENDGAALAGDAWDTFGWDQRRLYLQKRADLEVLRYMYTEGAISKEFMIERAKVIQAQEVPKK